MTATQRACNKQRVKAISDLSDNVSNQTADEHRQNFDAQAQPSERTTGGERGTTSAHPQLSGANLKQIDPRDLARRARLRLKIGAKPDPITGKLVAPQYPEEVIKAVEIEWTAGVKTVSEIAKEYGMQRATIYAWSMAKGWPKRADLQAQARQAINSKLMHDAVKEFRANAPEEVRNYLETLSASEQGTPKAALDAAKSAAILEDYAAVIARIIEAHRGLANDVVTVGSQLISMYKDGLEELRKQYKGDPGALMKASSTFIVSYRGLVGSLQSAIDLQRQAFSMDATTGGAGDPNVPQGGDAPTQPGSYEDIVREAEARGHSLT